MKKKQPKPSVSRRDFLKQSVLASSSLAFSNPAKIFLTALFSEMMAKNAFGAVSDSDFNFVNFCMIGAPPRWQYDLPLRPNGTADAFTVNPMVGTTFDAAMNPVYDTVTNPLFNGIHMPKLWSGLIPRPGGGTTPMANLAPNMLMLRGVDFALDSHELNPRRQVRPMPGAPSLTGLIADAATTPIPAMAYSFSANGGDPAAFGSAKGLSQATAYGIYPLETALAPFNNASSLTEISSAQVDAAIDNLFNLMKIDSNAKHQYVPTNYQTRASAKALMKRNFGDLRAAFNTLQAKYQSLINRSFLEAGLKLAGVDDIVIPGSTTSNKYSYEQAFRYSGTNFNNIFTADTTVSALAEGMAVAEWMLLNRISSSISVNTGGIDRVLVDRLFVLADSSTLTNQTNFGIGLDMHFIGSVTALASLTKFYRAHAACMYELINQLKTVTLANGKNLFQQTVIQLTSDFGRFGRADSIGSDHAPAASSSSIFSGMITKCELVGNTTIGPYPSFAPGSFGQGAPIALNDNRPLQLGNHISTVAALLEIPSPTPNDSPVISKNAAGVANINLPRGTNV